MHGILVIDKPARMTSRDVVNRVQRWFPRGTKVGHAGTLDPLATGVLVVCVGGATKLVSKIQEMAKTYHTHIRLGATSDTDDGDGTVTVKADATDPGEAAVRAALPAFVGSVQQLPPTYSALKIDGRRAHDLARRGAAVELAPRTVRIDRAELVQYQWPFADVEIDCGKGTYVRSIARDLGVMLGCGGLVAELRRTRIGPFVIEKAIGLVLSPEEAREQLWPMSAVK